MNTALLTLADLRTALQFYLTAGLIHPHTIAALEEAANKALQERYTVVDVNYLIEEFENSAFYYRAEEYGIAFMQSESVYALEQLVVDLVGFAAGRFQPEPLTVVFAPEPNGTMSFEQGGVFYERALFAEGHYLDNLLQLCNEAIVAKSGEAALLTPLYMSDGETQPVVLLSAEHLQTAQRSGMVASWYRPHGSSTSPIKNPGAR
ncbi:hypothetical protein [Hymenobacter lucidus]|uniref:Uncharacterized protein n=1 Tax=Hymenobacter lucidus TaxID=2880930 RepID=A0ABS8AZ70_9BACT|nr:hypothetical protein [Hymenobacter lucidus]MCB2411114.1 hypothetical protein [Hymenobacter lucidus]